MCPLMDFIGLNIFSTPRVCVFKGVPGTNPGAIFGAQLPMFLLENSGLLALWTDASNGLGGRKCG